MKRNFAFLHRNSRFGLLLLLACIAHQAEAQSFHAFDVTSNVLTPDQLTISAGDDILNFVHNINFTDVMWKHRLRVRFSGMTPQVGQMLTLYVRDMASGTAVMMSLPPIMPGVYFMEVRSVDHHITISHLVKKYVACRSELIGDFIERDSPCFPGLLPFCAWQGYRK